MDAVPDTEYGRLLEALHITGYSFERACSDLAWLLEEDRWMRVGGGFDDINVFLDSLRFDNIRLLADQRKKLARRIKELQPKASQRAIAKTLGVGKTTIQKDIGGRKGPNEPSKHDGAHRDSGHKGPRPITRIGGAAAARHVERRARRIQRETYSKRRVAESAPESGLPRTTLMNDDFRDLDIGAASIDLILTDPPYGKEYLELWTDLSRKASEWLKDGGVLVSYSGQFYLPRVISRLSESLSYLWCGSLITEGPHAMIHPRKVRTRSKPILFFSNGKRASDDWFEDTLYSEGRRKERHRWEQAVGPARKIIEWLTKPEDLVLDPFVGTGSVAVAARDSGRRFIGCDTNRDIIEVAKERLTL